MKTLISILLATILIFSDIRSQITDDFPFKTYLDNANNLFTVGYKMFKEQKDIYIQKYNFSGIYFGIDK